MKMLYFLPSPKIASPQKRKDFFYLKVGGGDRPVGAEGTEEWGGLERGLGTPIFWQISQWGQVMPTTLLLLLAPPRSNF